MLTGTCSACGGRAEVSETFAGLKLRCKACGKGWVPVDISEAWKHKEKRGYFFGAHDVNRVQFSVGRDIQLSPRQHGERLNYFIYPYVELGGKEYSNVANAFSFSDLKRVQQASTGTNQ